jgi:hypothetical protein
MKSIGDRFTVNGSEFEVVQVRGAALHESEGRTHLAAHFRRRGIADLVCRKMFSNGETKKKESLYILTENSKGEIESVSALE